MEAMACGVPCVGFNVGGIPEMIDHGKTGYVAKERDTDDLAKGIDWAIDASRKSELSANAVSKVQRCYSEHAVAMKYIDVYSDALAQRGYNI
jgi:glycosyltransferase involved in cell wall biosynthesis